MFYLFQAPFELPTLSLDEISSNDILCWDTYNMSRMIVLNNNFLYLNIFVQCKTSISLFWCNLKIRKNPEKIRAFPISWKDTKNLIKLEGKFSLQGYICLFFITHEMEEFMSKWRKLRICMWGHLRLTKPHIEFMD